MGKTIVRWTVFFCLVTAMLAGGVCAADKTSAAKQSEADFGLSKDMGDAMARQAGQVKKQLEKQAVSLFKRQPLGFDFRTFAELYTWAISLPLRLPGLWRQAVEQSRLLGALGSALIVIFILALLYSLLGRQRLMARIEVRLASFEQRIPHTLYAYILPSVRVVAAALVPLALLAVYTLIQALIDFDAAWFQLIGRLIRLWAIGALVIRFLRELLVNGLLRGSAQHGHSLFTLTRPVVLYVLAGIGLVWAAQTFALHKEILALFRFAVSITIILALFLLFLKKRAMLSLLPELPYPSYRAFRRLTEKYYYALIFFSLLVALLWSAGYRNLGSVVLSKLWFSGAAYIAVMLLYHLLQRALDGWLARVDGADDTAGHLYQSFKRLIIFGATLAVVLVVLNLFGLLGLLRQILSFPVFELGKSHVSLWILLKAGMILVIFLILSRLVQAYLDYRIYPAVGIEPGLGYALNTFLNYVLLILGVLVALNVVGLDLRFLLIFAGAAGIGIGLGLQSLVASVISGFTLIFGGKLRKGDWIEVNGTMGMVTDIYLRATNVRTRDNIEYLIPNSQLINGVLVNYSLGSPLIRISVPVGVAYDADPRQVEEILLEAARNEPLVSKQKQPGVVFSAYGDNSINFDLLVWIDVRAVAARMVRSKLYFAIFDALKAAGIEIPFPQRDLHIRSVPDTGSAPAA